MRIGFGVTQRVTAYQPRVQPWESGREGHRIPAQGATLGIGFGVTQRVTAYQPRVQPWESGREGQRIPAQGATLGNGFGVTQRVTAYQPRVQPWESGREGQRIPARGATLGMGWRVWRGAPGSPFRACGCGVEPFRAPHGFTNVMSLRCYTSVRKPVLLTVRKGSFRGRNIWFCVCNRGLLCAIGSSVFPCSSPVVLKRG
jgi:hypothetical protein